MRVLQTTTTLDKSGRPFVPFAIDVRFGSDEWHENDVVGCAYARSGKLYVKRGRRRIDRRPFLLGKNEDVVVAGCARRGRGARRPRSPVG